MKLKSLAAAFLLALTTVCPAQEGSAKQDPAGVRLVYNLPVDALQRALRSQPDSSMEKALTGAVQSVQKRLKGLAKVSRKGAASFTVDVPRCTPEELADIKRLVGMVGSLEMRMIACDDYDDTNLHLQRERERLAKWLEDGGRKKLLANPSAIDQFQPHDPKKVRWVVRRIKQKGNRWNYSLRQMPQTKKATVPLYDDKTWNRGNVIPGTAKQAELLEVIAVNMHEIGFTENDLDPAETEMTTDHADRPAIGYRLRNDKRALYADWSEKHRQRASAIIINGELVSAPIFVARIVGRGIITGSFDVKTAEALVTSLQSDALPTQPLLERQEPLPKRPK